MKRFILALALVLSLALPNIAAAEGNGMYLAPKFFKIPAKLNAPAPWLAQA